MKQRQNTPTKYTANTKKYHANAKQHVEQMHSDGTVAGSARRAIGYMYIYI